MNGAAGFQKTVLLKHQEDALQVMQQEWENQSQGGQMIFPTGTGKTIIEAFSIARHIEQNAGKFGIYMVMAPRIMLAVQLFGEVSKYLVAEKKMKACFFSLHSGAIPTKGDLIRGKWANTLADEMIYEDDEDMVSIRKKIERLPFLKSCWSKSGTSIANIQEAIDVAKSRQEPLIICSTYHSGDKIRSVLENADDQIDILICDEAHNTVAEEFRYVHTLPVKTTFHFTATRKTTRSDEGWGMNNETRYGPILSSMTPAQAILDKLIVRPRVHIVEINRSMPVVIDRDSEASAEIDAHTIHDAFLHHQAQIKNYEVGAKLLVAARGTKNIHMIMKASSYFEDLQRDHGVKIFSIFSGDKSIRINGEVVDRETFMKQMVEMESTEKAIIVHYDILSEGIDVPGITGIMPLRPLGLSKFMQMLGRATRLHIDDRKNPNLQTDSTMYPEWDKDYKKPFAWVVIPWHGALGDDLCVSVKSFVNDLRGYGWLPSEDVFFSEAGGFGEAQQLGSMFEREEKNVPSILSLIFDYHHEIEKVEATEVKHEKILLSFAEMNFDDFMEVFA